MDNDDFMHMVNENVQLAGIIPVIEEMYVGVRNFNPNNKEPPLSRNLINILSFKQGNIILITIMPNKNGWFEGYRANDPTRTCGIAHKSSIKIINFK